MRLKTVHGTYLQAFPDGTVKAVANPGPGATFKIEPRGPWVDEPPTVLPPGDTFRRMRGQLRIGETFFDDAGPINPVCCHAGDLFSLYTRDPAWAEAEAESIAQAGYQGVRVWFWLHGDYWTSKGRAVAPHTWTLVPEFCRMLERVGLRLMCSMGDMVRAAPVHEWAAYMREMSDRLKQFAPLTISVDVSNEAWNGTDLDVADLAEALQAFVGTYSVHVRSLTDSPEVDLDRWDAPPATVNDVHNYRGGHMHDKIRHIFSNSWEGDPPRRLGILSEPWGAPTTQQGGLVSVTEHPDEIDDEVIGLMTAQALIFGWWFTYMSSAGVSIRKRGEFETQPGFRVPPLVAGALPADVMTWRTWAHGGGSQRGRRVFVADTFEGGMRCDHAFGPNGQVAIVCYGGPDRTDQIPVERGVRGRWMNVQTGRFGRELLVSGGQRISLPPVRHGAVFVGELT